MTHWEIRTFLEIVKYKSISKAAQKLFLTQSTVSHRLNILEEELGVKLIIRRKGYRYIELTSEGEAFIPLAYEYEALWGRIEEFSQNGSKTLFSIGCHDSLNSFIFYKLMPKLKETAQPAKRKIVFRLESHNTSGLYQLLENGRLNIAFLREPVQNRNFIFEPFFQEQFKVVVLSDSPYKTSAGTMEEFDKEKGIELACPWGNEYMHWQERNLGNDWMPDISINAASTITKYLTEKAQWCIVPSSIAEEMEKTGKYRSVTLSDAPPPVLCYKVYLKSQLKAKSDVFDYFEEVLNEFIDTMPYLERIDI